MECFSEAGLPSEEGVAGLNVVVEIGRNNDLPVITARTSILFVRVRRFCILENASKWSLTQQQIRCDLLLEVLFRFIEKICFNWRHVVRPTGFVIDSWLLLLSSQGIERIRFLAGKVAEVEEVLLSYVRIYSY